MPKNRVSQLLMSVIRLWLLVTLVSGAPLFIHAPPPVLAQDDFAGGAGTESEPYLIATAAHLDNVRDYPDAHFRLIADINLGVAPWNEGEGWQPIGTTGTPFTGVFDGDIYVIFNLTVNRPTTDYQGLFGYLSGATVENLYLENVSVQGGQYTGGLAGRAHNSTIEHVQVTGEVNGVQDTGGLIGYLGGGSSVGHVSSEAAVQGGECTSGLVGYVHDASDRIYHAYTLGTVDGGLYTGGLVGRLYRGTVSDSYSRAAISGSSTVGGAVGYVNLSTSYVYRTYSTGAVTATTTTYLGGLVGQARGTVTDSYWDTETSGLMNSAGGTGKTTAEMQQRATFVNYNLYTLWQIDEGNDYPVFQELSAYPQPQDVDLADLDGDGKTDLAAAMYATAEVALFKGDGAADFKEATRFQSRGNLPSTLHIRDINKDGSPDIIVSHAHSDDSIVIFYGDGPFSFPLSQEIMLGKDRDVLEHEVRDIAVADLNGNGRMDIVAACHASASVIVLFNESDDDATPQRFRREEYLFDEGRPRALCVADFDKDERQDIAVALWDVNAVGFMRNMR